MQGRRIYSTPEKPYIVSTMEPGDYGIDIDGYYICYPPKDGAGPINISTWNVTVNSDGTITVSPSINVMNPDGSSLWHGFLKNGIWEEA